MIPRVVYLSAPPLGESLLTWLKDQPCEVVLVRTDDRRVDSWNPMDLIVPPYDLGINFLATHKIPASELAKAPWVNFHPGPLPEFGGRNLAYHAIMNGAKEFGATVHYMDEDFDTGEIIEVVRWPIQPWMTAGYLVGMARQNLVHMFYTWVPKLLKGKVSSTPQSGQRGYFKKEKVNETIEMTPEQEKQIRALTVCPEYSAKVKIGGQSYRIVPEIAGG